MKKLRHAVAAASLAVLGANTVYADQTSHVYGIHDRSSSHVAFTHATLIVEPGKSIKNATLVINQGRIVSVKAGGKIPQGATEIDLNDHFIYPGFIDAYSNYSIAKSNKQGAVAFDGSKSPKYNGTRKGGNAWNDAIHADVDWVDQFKPDNAAAKGYINNGFTAVQTAKFDGIFQGQGMTVSLADGLPNDLVYNAHASHFGSFDKGSSQQQYPSSLMGSIALIRQTLSDSVWYQKARGKIDTFSSGQPVEYNAALANLTELKSKGLMFNADDYLSTLRADKLFDQYHVNASFVADGHEYARIKQIKSTKATFIVPLNFPAKPDVSSFESQLDVSLAELRHWERAPSNPSVLANNKIPFALTLFGLKKPDQFWAKVKESIKNGLSEKQALAALTTVPAKLAGIADKAGRLKAGMFADLVITDGDIFDKGKINSVWLQGKEKKMLPIDPPSFAGNYAMDIGGTTLQLELKQAKNKVSGSLVKEDKKSKIKVSGSHDDYLQFSSNLSEFKLDDANSKDSKKSEVYRFTARLENGSLNGFYLDSHSHRTAFQAKVIVDANKDGKKKTADKTVKDNTAKLVSHLTFPDRAFGMSRHPVQQNLLIKNATIWTSESAGVLKNSDMLIKNGKIAKIAKNIKAPRGYKTIDASGKHVTAGIIDEHSHIAISKGVNEGSDAITAEVRIGDVVNPDDINIYRALAGGTTIAQLLHGSANPIGGQAQVVKLRWGDSAEQMKEKRAPGSIKFALGENVKQSNWGDNFTIRYPQTRMGVETIVRDGFIRAQEYKASWKKYDSLSRSQKKQIAPPRRDFRLETLVEILERKRFVHSHSYVASEILSLMNIAEDFNFRIQTFTHILEGYKVADEMAKHGATGSTFADWWAYKFEVLDAIPMNTCLMADKGVTVSVNSDSVDLIRRLNTEAAKSVQYCGMSQQEAIKMVTINPAKQLKINSFTGSLKKGKDADFVIWSDNPLSIYAKVEQTWIDGRNYFDRKTDLKKRQSQAVEKNALIQKLLTLDAGKKASDKKDGVNKEKVLDGKKSQHPKSQHSQDNDDANNDLVDQASAYIEKQPAAWQCDDNFDYWHWKSSQQGEQH